MVPTKTEIAKSLLLGGCDTCGWRTHGSKQDPTFAIWCVPECREPDRDRTLEKTVLDIPLNRTCEHYRELSALKEESSGTQKL